MKYSNNMIHLIKKFKKYKIKHNNYKKLINKNNLNQNSRIINKCKQTYKLTKKSIQKIKNLKILKKKMINSNQILPSCQKAFKI